MSLRFSKYQGIGNDFIVVDGDARALFVARAAAQALCDRHLGVGADGVLLVSGAAAATATATDTIDTCGDVSAAVSAAAAAQGKQGKQGKPAKMTVINADGSSPQMCGNGLRCVALHLHRAGKVGRSFHIDTDAGPHLCEVLDDGRIRVTMRAPSLAPAELPLRSAAPMIDASLEVAGQTLSLTAVSMGNPHAVVFDLPAEQRAAVGPALSVHPHFPEGVNAGFATRVSATHFELAVHERGAGWTRACGTGACAAAVAAVETGLAPRGVEIEIELPGGSLQVRVDEPGQPVTMTGPAAYVFSGTYG